MVIFVHYRTNSRGHWRVYTLHPGHRQWPQVEKALAEGLLPQGIENIYVIAPPKEVRAVPLDYRENLILGRYLSAQDKDQRARAGAPVTGGGSLL